MPTSPPRSDWRNDSAAHGLPMPHDPNPQPGVDWQALYDTGQGHAHEDSLDRLNKPARGKRPTWGTSNAAEAGGTGIVPAYSVDDFDAVVVAEKGVRDNPVQPDNEHLLRRFRYASAGWDMTHATYFARRLAAIDEEVTGFYSLSGPVHLFDPGWIPDNLANYEAMAHQRPGLGLPWNLRAFGETLMLRATRRKCDRSLYLSAQEGWDSKTLYTAALAAREGTGQLGNWQGDGATFDFERPGQTYSFHEGLFVMGVLAVCKRTRVAIPDFVFRLMDTLESLAMPGTSSMYAYWHTEGGRAVVEDRPDQKPDPAFGWWGWNCVAIGDLTGDRKSWNHRAGLFGPSLEAADWQSRVFTMAQRGQLA